MILTWEAASTRKVAATSISNSRQPLGKVESLMMRTSSSQFFSYRGHSRCSIFSVHLDRSRETSRQRMTSGVETRDRSPFPRPLWNLRTLTSRHDEEEGHQPRGAWTYETCLESRDTQEPYNSAPVFGSVWKAERAGKIKLFQKPGAFPSPRRIADRFSRVPLRSDTLSLTRRLPLSPALSLSLSQFPSPARPSTSSLSLPPTFAPLTASLSNRARSAAVVYPHHRRIHGPPSPPVDSFGPSFSVVLPPPQTVFLWIPPPRDISRGSVVFLVPQLRTCVVSFRYGSFSLNTRREWGEVSCSSNIPSTIHNRSMLARGDRGPKVDVHVRDSFNEIKLQVLDMPKVFFFFVFRIRWNIKIFLKLNCSVKGIWTILKQDQKGIIHLSQSQISLKVNFKNPNSKVYFVLRDIDLSNFFLILQYQSRLSGWKFNEKTNRMAINSDESFR